MSLLYKPKEEQTTEVLIERLKDRTIVLNFYSDCGKFGTIEHLDGYVLTAERLLQILQDERNSYSDDEM